VACVNTSISLGSHLGLSGEMSDMRIARVISVSSRAAV
jgi:hypothetical protein